MRIIPDGGCPSSFPRLPPRLSSLSGGFILLKSTAQALHLSRSLCCPPGLNHSISKEVHCGSLLTALCFFLLLWYLFIIHKQVDRHWGRVHQRIQILQWFTMFSGSSLNVLWSVVSSGLSCITMSCSEWLARPWISSQIWLFQEAKHPYPHDVHDPHKESAVFS